MYSFLCRGKLIGTDVIQSPFADWTLTLVTHRRNDYLEGSSSVKDSMA